MLVALLGLAALSIPLAALAEQAMSPEQRMAVLVNQARLAQGLNPVAISPELTAAAVAHTRDMIENGYMEHEARDGSTPQQRALRQGYSAPPGSAWLVVEVISARSTAEAALNWLLADRLHRGVVLRPIWREMGIAYQEGGPYGQLWTIEFGCRPNVLPVIADTTSSGGVTLRFTNEECAPDGGNANQIGRATEVMVSDRSDFSGATWEPFVTTKVISNKGQNLFVKLRDSRGREAVAATNLQGPTLTAAAAIPPSSLPSAAIIPDSPKASSSSPETGTKTVKKSSKKNQPESADNDSSADHESSDHESDDSEAVTSPAPVIDARPPGISR